MPVYCYRSEDGDTHERVCKMGQAPCKVCIDGKEYVRDYQAEHGHVPHSPGLWPMVSTSMGVSPRQRKEAYEESVKMGVPTRFDEKGRAVFETRGQRKRYAQAMGFRDNDGGYSDP